MTEEERLLVQRIIASTIDSPTEGTAKRARRTDTHFSCGHPIISENIALHPGKIKTRCLICKRKFSRDYEKKDRTRRKAAGKMQHECIEARRHISECGHHEFTEEADDR
jgi:hypothetical protein